MRTVGRYEIRPMKMGEYTEASWERMFDEGNGCWYAVVYKEHVIALDLTLQQAIDEAQYWDFQDFTDAQECAVCV